MTSPMKQTLEIPVADGEGERYSLRMGPQHPATHGVLRVDLELDGETILECKPQVGYLHRGFEKLAENRTYAQALILTDRLDYIAAMANNVGYCLAVEKLLGISVPLRAQYIYFIDVSYAIFIEIFSFCKNIFSKFKT